MLPLIDRELTDRGAAAGAMAVVGLDGVVELPAWVVWASVAYISLTIAIGVILALFVSPAFIIARPRHAYFDDWNVSQRAPWLFWHIAGFWYDIFVYIYVHFLELH